MKVVSIVFNANKIAISKLSTNVTTLGYGNRIVIWVQGCSIGCAGCCSKDTWETMPDKMVEIQDVVDWIANLPLSEFDGLTISGGEPLEQPVAVKRLLTELKSFLPPKFDILMYSGFPSKQVMNRHADVIALCDVVIAEPFRKDLPKAFLRGSSNQRLIQISELGKSRYNKPWDNVAEYRISESELGVIGIRDEQERIQVRQNLESKGISL